MTTGKKGGELGLEIIILGSGASAGVPRIDGLWGNANPNNQKNKRLRSCLAIRDSHGAVVLADCSPDIRAQCLAHQLQGVAQVLITHAHADQFHGLPELKIFSYLQDRMPIPVFSSAPCLDEIRTCFRYAFEGAGKNYQPFLVSRAIPDDGTPIPLVLKGRGGEAIFLRAYRVLHGEISSLAFRIGVRDSPDDLSDQSGQEHPHRVVFGYVPDVSDFLPAAWEGMAGLDWLIIDCLRDTPHPTHFHLEKSLDAIKRLTPRNACLTNLHQDLDYETLQAQMGPWVSQQVKAGQSLEAVHVAYDGMRILL